MEYAAVALLALYGLGYLLLGGADIGAGMLLPVLGRDERERRLVVTAIAPAFLGSEVWLVATAGVLVGAFPDLEGELLSGMFPAIVALLVGWMVRDMGLWSRGRVDARGWRAACDIAICAGSWAVAGAWGLVFVWAGETGIGRVGPLPGIGALMLAALVAAVFAFHGLGWAGTRLGGAVGERVAGLVGRVGGWRLYALTSAAMLLVGLGLGARLPLRESAADGATLAVLVPALLIVTPFLMTAQAGMWWLLRGRVREPGYF
ncbi:cytochrome d ubiquinol oxidase subunit II [Phytomonospora sp. NPDC050363]|uniref:cytochrome d ubiquinol oxidase subunit II n=1 Tax=Phytomonospora sp. NPDC050363 TaxID=3155642 RepID=UPI0033DF8F6B